MEETEGRTEKKKKDKAPLASIKVISLAKKYLMYKDRSGTIYAFVNSRSIPIEGKQFKNTLINDFYKSEKYPAGKEAINAAISVLSAQTAESGIERRLELRVYRENDNIYYDLCNGRVVRISGEGWSIEAARPMFRSLPHQKEQVEPAHGGDVHKIFNYLNISENAKLLMLCYLIACFIPDIARPILHPIGSQGMGKTTMGKVIRALIDPSNADALITPKDEEDVKLNLYNNYYPVFDNLSGVDSRLSDILSQVVTGCGFERRELYTDNDVRTYRLQRTMCLTGINCVTKKPDLMERVLLMPLERIDERDRKEERLFWNNFNADKPFILGGIFDTLSRAISIYPTLRLDRKPRLADFATWGYAIAEALGYSGDDFLKAYILNKETREEELIHGDTLLQTIIMFMADRDTYTGYMKDYYKGLKDDAKPESDDKSFPKSENKLRAALERIRETLNGRGILFVIHNRDAIGYKISLWKKNNVDDVHPENVSTRRKANKDAKNVGSVLSVDNITKTSGEEERGGLSESMRDAEVEGFAKERTLSTLRTFSSTEASLHDVDNSVDTMGLSTLHAQASTLIIDIDNDNPDDEPLVEISSDIMRVNQV
ncbi:MAG: hypothetical protein HQK97_06285 [Nitrospirae bacterium]|nr:hypothetical protein [Nitrospirota bacterium]